ncbi:MAG TPA: FKBP-type peptidyl-prolyl cis-trans isomerase [Ilumatobacteraceae bacterium]|nr:FKBP-type peptidyl-prolyl cis-trans isomerase [Ilumatobacteraceae bacterium]HRB04088.1 FKBP-type peptidyl-prolyl cis-trans isomerase [Ilumatobacteraceae bacterium]
MRVLRPTAVVLSCLLLVTACGDASSSSNSVNSTDGTTAPIATGPLQKPTVSVPSELPTELGVSDISVGTGPKAAEGDTVIVHYVGVRTADGAEFDNSFDRGQPLEVTLGTHRVIAGWEQGLAGMQQGGRRQLDIPAALAYGDSPPAGGIIKAGDSLTFVVDMVAVLPTSTLADEPQITLGPADNIPVMTSTDLIEGTGASPADGDNVAIHVVAFRADTGEKLTSDWGGPPITFLYGADTTIYPGIIAEVKGMKVGGRRQAQLPFVLMFDGQGSQQLSLPPSIDVVLVIDLIALY